MYLRRSGFWGRLVETTLVIVVVAAAATTAVRAQAKQDGDEAEWIGTSRYFLTLFVRHDLSDEAWADSYWTRTQPMVARYVIGAWLWSRGQDPESFDPRYDHFRKWFTNQREGRAPSEEMLAEARIPMRALVVVCAVLVYGIVRVSAGPVGGLVAALLFVGSPYLTLHLIRAKGDTTLLVLLLAALLAGLAAIGQGGPHGPSWRLGIVVGLFLGLALGAKLTAVLAILAVIAWGAWALAGPLAARLVGRRPGADDRPAAAHTVAAGPAGDSAAGRALAGAGAAGRRGAAIWAVGVVLVAGLMFVASNPFLYRDPFGRTVLLFQNRHEEMARQAAVDPSRAVTRIGDRVSRVWRLSLIEDTWGRSRLRWPLEALLAVTGAGWLALRAARWQPGPDAWLLLWVAALFAGVTLGLGYQLDHYFVPTAVSGIVLGGLAVGWSAQAAWSAARRVSRRDDQPLTRPTSAPA